MGQAWRFVHAGSINRVKDPRTLLSAFAQICNKRRDVVLEWAGEDTLSGEARRWAQGLGIADRVHFLDRIGQHELAAIHRGADVYLHASRYESQSVAVLEAALAGLPVVGTRVGLIHDLAPHAAVAVDVGDASALAAAALQLLDDARQRHDLAKNAQAYARVHDADWTASAFEDLYLRRA
jgi:glycosyltransferase involved in cell wall biosynthesis